MWSLGNVYVCLRSWPDFNYPNWCTDAVSSTPVNKLVLGNYNGMMSKKVADPDPSQFENPMDSTTVGRIYSSIVPLITPNRSIKLCFQSYSSKARATSDGELFPSWTWTERSTRVNLYLGGRRSQWELLHLEHLTLLLSYLLCQIEIKPTSISYQSVLFTKELQLTK